MLPAASFARASNVCEPSARPLYAFGLAQPPQLPPSRRHSNFNLVARLTLSEPLKEMLAEEEATVPDGAATMAVSGGVESRGLPFTRAGSAGSSALEPRSTSS